MLPLEPTIQSYLQALSQQQTHQALACFDPEAVVISLDQIWVGAASIGHWQYHLQQHQAGLKVLASHHYCGETHLSALVPAGRFHFHQWRYVFALQDGKISRLIVEPGAAA